MRTVCRLVVLPAIFGLLTTLGVQVAYAAWNSRCDPASATVVDRWSRVEARSYALTAVGDGYEWGGGCWNSNGHDDTPGVPDSGGEGADCSGFTFKSWSMALNWGNTKTRWSPMENVHGPYTAAAFKAGNGAAVAIGKSYSTTAYMDAFASSTHIGMIYSESSDGYDRIIEAKGDAAGTGIFTRSYRVSGSYGGVRRYGWNAYCPQCQ